MTVTLTLTLALTLTLTLALALTLTLTLPLPLALTLDRGGGGEDDVLAVVLGHDVEQVDGTRDVVLVVEQRLAHRLAHRLQPREVDDGVIPTEAQRSCSAAMPACS